MELTEAELDQVFTLWEERYRANPERFMSDAKRFGATTAVSYGAACTRTFIGYADEIREKS